MSCDPTLRDQRSKCVIFSKFSKCFSSYRLHSTVTWLMHIDQLDTLYKIYGSTGFLHSLNKKIPWLFHKNSMTFCFSCIRSFYKKNQRKHSKAQVDPLKDLWPNISWVICVSLFKCPMSKSHPNLSTWTMWEQFFSFWQIVWNTFNEIKLINYANDA